MKNNNTYPYTAVRYLLHAMASNIHYAARQKVKTWPYSMPLFVHTNEQYLQTHYFRDIHTDNKNEIFQNEHPLSITEIIEQYPQFIWAYTL